ncbi:hypothetical protein ISG33_12565 [Glaciecola sp. MH2013]|uniref:hypothetical protein n=1 Tax=Glaciecola sp. MH2013 TaxID=2785524 RepID=UPI00189DAB58|nr:hypothetical protein [Glaciecola sp. MH2013]MBF7074234.1 hypothetical protein [Glaciecola sp. MH2013]
MIKLLHLAIAISVAILLSIVGYSYYFHSGLELDRLLYMAISTVVLYLTLISSSSYKLNVFKLLAITCIACGFTFSALNHFFGFYKEFYVFTPWSELLCLAVILILFALAVKNEVFTKNKLSSQINLVRLKPHVLISLSFTFILVLMKLMVVVLGLGDTGYQFAIHVLNTTFTLWVYAFFPVILIVCLLVLISKRLGSTSNRLGES